MCLCMVESCPVCGRSPHDVIWSNVSDLYGRGEHFNVVRCTSCTHTYTTPVPSYEMLTDWYPKEYYSSGEQADVNTFRHLLKKWIYKKSSSSAAVRFAFSKQLAILPEKTYHGKLLDVGCGDSRFLSFMKDFGWDTYGTEISPYATERANRNGHKVFCGNLEDAGLQDDYFDLITLNNVLEHLHDPKHILNEIYRILKPDGELIICVPNFDCWDRRHFGRYWDPLKLPQHLHHFNVRSLKLALTSSGLIPFRSKYLVRMRAKSNL